MKTYANLPEQLKTQNQWCVAGPDKSPYVASGNSLRRVSVKELGALHTFQDACELSQRFGAPVGYVLSAIDPFTCIDLDVKDIESRDNQGAEYPANQLTTESDLNRFNTILERFESYTELSTSGKGAHIWVLGNIGSGCKRAGIEVYSQERFMICTGNAVQGLRYSLSPAGVVIPNFEKSHALATAALPELLEELVSDVRKAMAQSSDFKLAEVEETDFDRDIVERLMKGGCAERFNALCNGEWQDFGYPSQSEADLALMSYFATLSESNEQCRRLFRMTKLGKREKAVKNNKYLDRTLKVVRAKQAEEKTRLEMVQNSPLVQSANTAAPQFSSGQEVDWKSPPGLAGDICEYMRLTAKRPRPELYPIAALHLMALVGRSRKSEFKTKLNLLSLSIAPTAAGKEHPQEKLKQLAHRAGCSNLIHGNAGSFKDIVMNLVDGDGAGLYVVDEVHSLFNSMHSRNAQTYESKIEAEILKLSTTDLYNFRGIEKREALKDYESRIAALKKQVGDGDEVSEGAISAQSLLTRYENRLNNLENGWEKPFFSLMGHSVPDRLDEFVSEENINGGFIGRTLVVRCPDDRARLRTEPVSEDKERELETRIIDGLSRIALSNVEIAPDDAGKVILDAACEWFEEDEQRNHDVLGGIYARAAEHLYRIAAIYALEQGTVTEDIAKSAYALVRSSIDDIEFLLLQHLASKEGATKVEIQEHAKKLAIRNCRGQGLPLSRLKTLVTKKAAWKAMQKNNPDRNCFDDFISMMTSGNLLAYVEKGRKKRYVTVRRSQDC